LTTYLDSSLIVSLYAIDANSASAVTAMSLCAETPIITTLSQIEVLNAFELQVFRKQVSQQRTDVSVNNFEADLQSGIYRVKPLSEAAFTRARQISRKFTATVGVRTADLLHVAAALELGADAFFTFDLQQRKLASAVGLSLNPL
jgi:predicted nucleic acid-binding protein